MGRQSHRMAVVIEGTAPRTACPRPVKSSSPASTYGWQFGRFGGNPRATPGIPDQDLTISILRRATRAKLGLYSFGESASSDAGESAGPDAGCIEANARFNACVFGCSAP